LTEKDVKTNFFIGLLQLKHKMVAEMMKNQSFDWYSKISWNVYQELMKWRLS